MARPRPLRAGADRQHHGGGLGRATHRAPAGMTPVEAAVGVPFDEARGRGRMPLASKELAAPAEALEEALLPALHRPPCVVAFSGGRDSSGLLGAAVHAARRHGLPEPVAVTLRFPGRADTDESAWQELVARSLRLERWERVEIGDELDFVGPLTTPWLERHGPLYPPNACLLVPIASHARGGSVVVGVGGDELFGLWQRRRLADVAARRARPRPRDVAGLALALAPLRARRTVLARRTMHDAALPWLTPAGRAELASVEAAELAAESSLWSRFAPAVARRRDVTLALRTLKAIGDELDVSVHAPLADPGFAAALGRAGGWTGWGDRGAAMTAAFDGRIPREVLERTDKAILSDVFWTGEARRFARAWSGSGLDEEIVDAEALRATWLSEKPDHRSATLLQAAWLHDHRNGAR